MGGRSIIIISGNFELHTLLVSPTQCSHRCTGVMPRPLRCSGWARRCSVHFSFGILTSGRPVSVLQVFFFCLFVCLFVCCVCACVHACVRVYACFYVGYLYGLYMSIHVWRFGISHPLRESAIRDAITGWIPHTDVCMHGPNMHARMDTHGICVAHNQSMIDGGRWYMLHRKKG